MKRIAIRVVPVVALLVPAPPGTNGPAAVVVTSAAGCVAPQTLSYTYY